MIIDASLLCVKSFIHRLQDSSCKVPSFALPLIDCCSYLQYVKDFTQVEPQVVCFSTTLTSEHPSAPAPAGACVHILEERERERILDATTSWSQPVVWRVVRGLEGLDFVSEKDLVYCATTATRSTFNIKLSQYSSLLGASVLVQTHDLVLKFCIVISSSSLLEEEKPPYSPKVWKCRNSQRLVKSATS